MKYEFIEEHDEYSVAKWAGFFGVSTSGYYEWIGTKEARKEREDAYKAAIQKAADEGKGTYGADRICGKMRQNGLTSSFKKVKKLMNELGIDSIHNRHKRRCLTNSKKARDDKYKNLVRGKVISKPFEVIASDISCIRSKEGFTYTCIIKDVKSGVILSSNNSDNMKKELATDTIKAAIKRWNLGEGTIFHSDRGSQYTARVTKDLLSKYKIGQSFSRVGMPGDNAWCESYFANMKKEAVHWEQYTTRYQVDQAMFYYVNAFYNTKRIQKRLGYLSPYEWLYRQRNIPKKLVA